MEKETGPGLGEVQMHAKPGDAKEKLTEKENTDRGGGDDSKRSNGTVSWKTLGLHKMSKVDFKGKNLRGKPKPRARAKITRGPTLSLESDIRRFYKLTEPQDTGNPRGNTQRRTTKDPGTKAIKDSDDPDTHTQSFNHK